MRPRDIRRRQRKRIASAIGAVLVIAAGASEVSSAALATTITVSNCSDSGSGSLRAALAIATDGSTIDLSQLGCSTITLTSGQLVAGTSVTLRGPAPPQVVTIDGAGSSRVLDHTGADLAAYDVQFANGRSSGFGGCIRSSGNVSLTGGGASHCGAKNASMILAGGAISVTGNLTLARARLTNNYCRGSHSYGGAVYVAGSLVVRDSTISSSVAASDTQGLNAAGGGVFAKGKVDISGSAVYANVAGAGTAAAAAYYGGNGGGIVISSPGATTATIVDSTISGNFAAFRFGGIYSNRPLTMANSTVANNTEYDSNGFTIGAGVFLFNTTGTFTSSIIFGNRTYLKDQYGAYGYYAEDVDGPMTFAGSHDVVGYSKLALPPDTRTADPLLAPLADNGGPTVTHALNLGSGAIGNGSNPLGLVDDQRGPGFSRTFARAVDIGAFQTGDSIFNSGLDPPQ